MNEKNDGDFGSFVFVPIRLFRFTSKTQRLTRTKANGRDAWECVSDWFSSAPTMEILHSSTSALQPIQLRPSLWPLVLPFSQCYTLSRLRSTSAPFSRLFHFRCVAVVFAQSSFSLLIHSDYFLPFPLYSFCLHNSFLHTVWPLNTLSHPFCICRSLFPHFVSFTVALRSYSDAYSRYTREWIHLLKKRVTTRLSFSFA